MNFNGRTLYDCTNARFDGTAKALTDEQLLKMAPSIFAEDAHESRSDKFMPIPTIQVLNALRKEGFMPVAARQSGTRDVSRTGHTKHLIRLRHANDMGVVAVGSMLCEIILRNANDGTACYELLAGGFRPECANSLVTQVSTVDTVKIKHTGRDIPGQVIDGTYTVLDHAKEASAEVRDWSVTKMPQEARMALARAAYELRFDREAEDAATNGIQPAQLLGIRRHEDRGEDLWRTWNAVQENCIRGGLRGMRRDEHGQMRRTTMREVRGIDQDVKLNRALWMVGEQLFQTLKRAA